ncbi:MAG: hypothetical protein P8Y44_04190 [Acidobacteriota bacterium]
MKNQLDEWNRDIDALEDKIAAATGPAREELRQRLDKTRKSFDGGRAKLSEIQASGEESWKKLRDEAEHIWDTLKHSINYFRSQL